MVEELITKEEAITSYRDYLIFSAKDEDLIAAINKAVSESKDLKDKMDNVGRKNKLIWQKGTSKDMEKIHPNKAKIVSNRIFTDVETAIPILTSEPPEPTILGNIPNAVRINMAKGMEMAYEVKYKVQQQLQRLIRNWFLFRLGVWKYRWDADRGFVSEVVLTKNVGIDKKATSKENCEYIWEEIEDTVEGLLEKFPKKSKDIRNQLALDPKDKVRLKSKVKYIEFWGGNGKWVCWKLKDIILDKKKNPNWDYEINENNLFDHPEFPYLFLNVFNIGDETGLYDETSLVEEATPMQEGVSQIEQQIIELNEGRKRVWVASSEAVSEQNFQELIDETGDLGMYLDRRAPTDSVRQVQAGIPDSGFFNNLQHLLGEIDNTIGMHSTTRGERAQQETLGGRQLLMGSDYGRLDLITRNVEQVMEEWYLAYLHMLKVYSDEAEILSNGEITVELRSEQIPPGIKIMIRKGSTLPIDKRTKMEQAIQLAQWDKIDPATLFEELGYDNVKERVDNLYQWLAVSGKINPAAVQGATGEAIPELQQIQQALQSPGFQQAPPEQQQKMVQQARKMVDQIRKGGGQRQ